MNTANSAFGFLRGMGPHILIVISYLLEIADIMFLWNRIQSKNSNSWLININYIAYDVVAVQFHYNGRIQENIDQTSWL
jgi:hypothetical protein